MLLNRTGPRARTSPFNGLYPGLGAGAQTRANAYGLSPSSPTNSQGI